MTARFHSARAPTEWLEGPLRAWSVDGHHRGEAQKSASTNSSTPIGTLSGIATCRERAPAAVQASHAPDLLDLPKWRDPPGQTNQLSTS
ncbi:hypothetical protein [Promicromonospora soli]|nr:hypothetical protein [Promicromonospora soli]